MISKLVFWTAFNSYQSPRFMKKKPRKTIHPVRTPEWTRRRVELFEQFNLPSILRQTHEDFLYIVLLDPKLKHLTESMLPKIDDSRIIYCYEDAPTLERLRKYDEIVFSLIDSDDMYARTAGEAMMVCPAKWMYFRRGYAYDARHGNFWNYDTISTGPFFAQRINPYTMSRFDRDKRHPTHPDVIRFKPKELAHGQFCVVLHDRNTSSHLRMRHILKKKPADKKILETVFGLRK